MTRGAPPTVPEVPSAPDASAAEDVRARAAAAGRRLVPVDALFSPYVVALALYVPLLVLFLATPRRVFDETFSTTKYTSAAGLAFYVLAIAAFVVGALIGDVLARRPGADGSRRLPVELVSRLRVVLALALAVALAAYGGWLGLAIWRAGGLAGFVDVLQTDPDYVRRVLFATVPGVTTLTQVALAAVPIAIAYRLLDRRLLAPLVGLVVLLALTVALLGSFRLTFLELLVVVGYLAVAGRRTSTARLVAVGAAIVVVVAAFFVLAEIRRRGAYEPYGLDDAVLRLFSYYVNSINNTFAIVESHTFALPLYFTTQPFWEFPGVSHVLRYEDVFAADSVVFNDNFHRVNGLTRGVTTLGLPGEAHVELGWAALWQILGLGGVAGALYRAAQRDPFYRALYAVWLVGMLEFVRINYFVEPRMVPAYALFALVFVLVVLPAARVRRVGEKTGAAP